LLVRIEPVATCQEPEALLARVQKSFQQLFALRVPVELAAPGSLPRFEMKAKRWICTVDGRGRG
jgi:phenylacetate-CoA ligase